jgi:hypothetical protein
LAKRCKLAHAFRWEYSYRRLKLAQLLGQLGVFLTCCSPTALKSQAVPSSSVHAPVAVQGAAGLQTASPQPRGAPQDVFARVHPYLG